MKRLMMLSFIMALYSCTSDQESLDDMKISEVNLISNIDGCSVYDLEFGQEAIITVRNYYDYLEVRVNKISSKSLNKMSIHFAKDLADFPKKGNGQLNPSEFYYSEPVDKAVDEVILRFNFKDLNIAVGEEIMISAVAQFGKGKNREEHFATDETLTNGKFYFTYQIENFKNYAGTDQVREITLSEAIALPSWDEVRKVYAGMLDPGVNRNEGVYNPSIWDLIYDFNDPNRETQLGDYTTTYILGTGDCHDSVELTMRVIPDSQ